MRNAAFVLAVLAVALTGCGGNGDGERLSADEFRQRANAICAEYDEKLSALGDPQSPADIPQYVEEAVPLIEQGLAELRAVNPPEELQDDYDAMLDETAKAIPAARRLSEAAADQDAAAVQEAIEEGQRADEASDRIAARLGLDECSSGE